jgi:hypothetical protein
VCLLAGVPRQEPACDERRLPLGRELLISAFRRVAIELRLRLVLQRLVARERCLALLERGLKWTRIDLEQLIAFFTRSPRGRRRFGSRRHLRADGDGVVLPRSFRRQRFSTGTSFCIATAVETRWPPPPAPPRPPRPPLDRPRDPAAVVSCAISRTAVTAATTRAKAMIGVARYRAGDTATLVELGSWGARAKWSSRTGDRRAASHQRSCGPHSRVSGMITTCPGACSSCEHSTPRLRIARQTRLEKSRLVSTSLAARQPFAFAVSPLATW